MDSSTVGGGAAARVCPYCSHEVRTDGVCLFCGRKLDPGDWPVKTVFSSVGLRKIEDGDGVRYVMNLQRIMIE